MSNMQALVTFDFDKALARRNELRAPGRVLSPEEKEEVQYLKTLLFVFAYSAPASQLIKIKEPNMPEHFRSQVKLLEPLTDALEPYCVQFRSQVSMAGLPADCLVGIVSPSKPEPRVLADLIALTLGEALGPCFLHDELIPAMRTAQEKLFEQEREHGEATYDY